jgi:4-amino-4-deoxy-L-arabinose transferase-like glycosyltransferase
MFALVVGAWLRLRGITWGLPESYYFDEEHVVKRALAFGTGDLNPHWFHKPALFFYVLFFEYGLFYLGGHLLGRFGGTEDFAVSFFLDPGPFYLIGRLTVCALGVATIFLVHLLGTRIAGRRCGALAALVYAVCAGAVAASKVVKADVPCAFLATLSLLFLVRMIGEERGEDRKRDAWAGLLAGLGTATKYYPMALALPLVLAHGFRARRAGERILSLRLLLGPFCLLVGFFAGSPYNFLDSTWARETWVNRILPVFGRGDAIANDATYAGEGLGAAIVDLFSVVVSADGMGPVLGGLALLGVLLLLVLAFLRREDRPRAGVLGSALFFFLALCVVFNPSYAEARHLAIVYPVLAVTAALPLASLLEKAGAGGTKVLALVPLLLLGAGLVTEALFSYKLSDALVVPDPRNRAREWIETHVAPGTKILMAENQVKIRSTIANLESESEIARGLEGDGEDPAFTRHLGDYYRFRILAAREDPGPRYDILRFYHPWWLREEPSSGETRYTTGQDRRMGNPVLLRGVGSLDDYLRRGYGIVVVPVSAYDKYLHEPFASRFPSFSRFYRDMEEKMELWQEFSDPACPEVVIRIFRRRQGDE